MPEKKNKCTKCEIYFKPRLELDTEQYTTLCWNCRFIVQCIMTAAYSLCSMPAVNRSVEIAVENIIIKKK